MISHEFLVCPLPDLKLPFLPPVRGSQFSACYDLIAQEDITVQKGVLTTVYSGFIAEPKLVVSVGVGGQPPQELDGMGVRCLILPRSGQGSKGVHIANTAGEIDMDYRGQWITKLYIPDEPFFNSKVEIPRGTAYAQVEIAPVLIGDRVRIVAQHHLSTTVRGEGGFGHTDKK